MATFTHNFLESFAGQKLNQYTKYNCYSIHYININDNLLGQRNIEIGTDAIDTSRGDTDVIIEETLVPIVTDRIGSTSLNDLILSIAENQMTSWKPDTLKRY